MNKKILEKCTLFSGLEGDAFTYALHFFDVQKESFKKGDFLNRISSPLTHFGLVLSGIVQVYAVDIDGNAMIMANVNPGETFGESLCYLGIEAPIYIVAFSDSEIFWLKTDRVKAPSQNPQDLFLASRFTAMLAARTLQMNDRIQILSKITLREKLITFFSQYAARYNSNTFTIPFDRNNMAVYLGTNRSALSRELSRMKKEQILDYSKNKFILHKQ